MIDDIVGKENYVIMTRTARGPHKMDREETATEA